MRTVLKCTLGVAFMVAVTTPAFAVNTSSREYKDAYACGLEAVKGGETTTAGVATSCVGNSHDPSSTEMKGFGDAIRDSKKSQSSSATKCTFAYGVYEANGSRSDGFAEGPTKIHTLRNVAHMVSSRSITLYDASNKPIPSELANSWFARKGNDFVVSPLALKTCSKKQLGKDAYGG
ncbi:hypothetical protein [uncultured Deefgea sp.]|uniref:hypothetical protein n=1 Tax=uncultured Deefgea sp. TaxID=1304914 RepID=UPI0025964C7A|nr:hypothetical protein [uncultured Deefgea sp.]